jgi:CRISPR-associated endonuclease Csn1
VRKHDEIDSMSVNFLTVEGALTSKLKSDWGLHDKWNELIAPRFKRLNEITNSDAFGRFDASINCFRPDVPLDQKKGFNKKRIDHRHHAMDALVIACATRKHIQYLNSLNNEKVKYELREGLVVKNKQGDYTKSFCMPWEGFPIHALDALSRTIISFKQNIRVINKTTNRYQHWEKKNGQPKKVMTKQTKGTSWAIRKSLHKESVYGKVSIQQKREVSFANGIKDWKNLVDRKLRNKVKKLVGKGYSEKEIQKHFKENPVLIEGKPVKRVEIYDFTNNTTAKREPLTEITTRKKLESITDSGIRNILQNHLENYTDEKGNEDYSTAFSQEGIDTMNANIVQLNDGKKHKPVFHVRLYEKGNRFPVGTNGINIKKFVEAAKGTNLFFAIYVDEETGKRSYETIPLNEVIEHQKWRATLSNLEQKDTPLIPVKPKMGRFLFYLSPNDLVYVPTLEEQENPNLVDIYQLTAEQVHRVYKMVSSSLSQAFFIRHDISIPIFNKVEFSPLNKMEKSLGGTMIKEVCWKINVDRLGHISSITK